MELTKAGEKWIEDKSEEAQSLPDYTDDWELRANIEFWLRAFVDEVEKRADKNQEYAPSSAIAIGQAFIDITRELLGDDQ